MGLDISCLVANAELDDQGMTNSRGCRRGGLDPKGKEKLVNNFPFG
jgi:hypothetical protein